MYAHMYSHLHILKSGYTSFVWNILLIGINLFGMKKPLFMIQPEYCWFNKSNENDKAIKKLGIFKHSWIICLYRETNIMYLGFTN